ncbi:MAG: hypothetical protein ACYSW8_26560 [Planctomycetota bacterium]|jgi:hypothetical protein
MTISRTTHEIPEIAEELTREKIEIRLGDDGTLDKVFSCNCRLCGVTWDERFTHPHHLDETEMMEVIREQALHDCFDEFEDCVEDMLDGNS